MASKRCDGQEKEWQMVNVHKFYRLEQVLPQRWLPPHENGQNYRFHHRLRDDGVARLFLRVPSNLALQRGRRVDPFYHSFRNILLLQNSQRSTQRWANVLQNSKGSSKESGR
jgi:hypothetical protein